MWRLCINNHLGDLKMNLKTKLQELISAYEADLREWEDGYTFVENEVDFYMQKGKMSKLDDIIIELKELVKCSTNYLIQKQSLAGQKIGRSGMTSLKQLVFQKLAEDFCYEKIVAKIQLKTIKSIANGRVKYNREKFKLEMK